MTTHIKAGETSKFRRIDYGSTWLKLGAERPHRQGASPGGLTLDADDMRVLASILRVRLPVGQDHGRTAYLESAAESSPALKLLADWCEAGAEWQERHASELHVH